jgi:hypothetical protein
MGGGPEQAGGDAVTATSGAPADDDVAPDRATGPGLPRGTTGLGLAIALSIARSHGERIDLETAAGQGSRFVVRLPLGADGSLAAAEREAKREA